jgi:hypothetical protein
MLPRRPVVVGNLPPQILQSRQLDVPSRKGEGRSNQPSRFEYHTFRAGRRNKELRRIINGAIGDLLLTFGTVFWSRAAFGEDWELGWLGYGRRSYLSPRVNRTLLVGPAHFLGHCAEVVTQDRQGHGSTEGMAVTGSGVDEQLPVTCPCIAEDTLLNDGTTQRDVSESVRRVRRVGR